MQAPTSLFTGGACRWEKFKMVSSTSQPQWILFLHVMLSPGFQGSAHRFIGASVFFPNKLHTTFRDAAEPDQPRPYHPITFLNNLCTNGERRSQFEVFYSHSHLDKIRSREWSCQTPVLLRV
jgi:hypothetical protein